MTNQMSNQDAFLGQGASPWLQQLPGIGVSINIKISSRWVRSQVPLLRRG